MGVSDGGPERLREKRSLHHNESSKSLSREGNPMSRMNMEPLLSFHDGSHLVMSTQCSKDGIFSCALYMALFSANDEADYRIVSRHMEAETCLRAQEHAYQHAVHLYPNGVQKMKPPPYLIWHGPQRFL